MAVTYVTRARLGEYRNRNPFVNKLGVYCCQGIVRRVVRPTNDIKMWTKSSRIATLPSSFVFLKDDSAREQPQFVFCRVTLFSITICM